ncbi:glycosyl transferase family 1 [Streptomyces daqingensis]|uniref:Glycosyl transferase family 1 n=1 Tax=Streptomyces daqingensis TaxID=1472640 RepID=A0ABQ2MIN4_9ACTN|nr:glycosyl transferase family 1 [Streptomyces daqingensis]
MSLSFGAAREPSGGGISGAPAVRRPRLERHNPAREGCEERMVHLSRPVPSSHPGPGLGTATPPSPLRRVVVVCHQYPPWTLGGLAEYAQRFVQCLQQERGDVPLTLYTLNCPENLARRERNGSVTIRRPWLPRWLKRRIAAPKNHLAPSGRALFALSLLAFNLATLPALVRARRPGTVVAVHDWQSAVAGILAAGLLRLPVVYHVHNTEMTMADQPDVTDPFRLIETAQRLLARFASRIVVPTPELGRLAVAHGWRGDRIDVVPHGCETGADPADPDAGDAEPVHERERARTGLREEFGLPPDAPLLVFAGRLSSVKGVPTLLRALPAIARRHPGVQLVMLGVGLAGTDQDAAVDRLVTELGIGDRTHVYHRYLPQEEVRRHYLAADVCVFPSRYEPFGLVSVEAMALAAPVVLGSGFSALISDDERGGGQAALRMSGDTPDELAALVCQLLDDPVAAARLAARGRAHARQNFRWPDTVTRTLGLYESLTRREPSRG